MAEGGFQEILAKFDEVIDSPYDWLRRWKDENKVKVVVCSPMHFPEELIHAAGMLPVVLIETKENVTEGYSRVHPFFCGITRNVMDLAAKGRLAFFDGLLYSNICIQNANVAMTLKRMFPAGRVAYVQLPTSLERADIAADARRELEKTRTVIEGIAGRKIHDEDIARSIALYNRHRSLLRQIHEWCRRNPGRLTFGQRQAVVTSGLVMPKEEHVQLLERLLKALDETSAEPSGGPRLFLSGHLCQAPKREILDLIEETGARIVDDDLYTGYRYYALDVDPDGQPMESLVERYLDRSVPIPTRSDGKIRWDGYIAERAAACGADGVVILLAKYCEPHMFAYPFIKRTLAERGLPQIMIETEHEAMSLEGVRTRLQAFVEMLG